jgi:hypothetical protein
MVDYGDNIIVATADSNGTTTTGGDKGIYRINKTSKNKFSFYQDTTVLTTANIIKGLSLGSYGGSTLQIYDATKVEKVLLSNNSRILGPNAAAGAFINAPATAPCTAMSTLLTGGFESPTGRIVTFHGNAAGRIGVFNKDGFVTASACDQAVSAANSGLFVAATGQPTSILKHSSGKLLVGYGSSATNASNAILAFDYDDSSTAASISNQTLAYYLPTWGLNQPSALVEDTTAGLVYVASFASGTVDSFTFDSATKTLTRVGTVIPASAYTNCVSGMFVGN